MPYYQRMGRIPAKRHTQFYKEDGSLFREQVMGTKGFSGPQSILYHGEAPTWLSKIAPFERKLPQLLREEILRPRHIHTAHAPLVGDTITGRNYLLGNEDLSLGLLLLQEEMSYFYRNGEGDELLFIHEGEGVLETQFGQLSYRSGDYLVIPIGTIYRLTPNNPKEEIMEGDTVKEDATEGSRKTQRILFLETNGWLDVPERYRNEWGQFLEHSPFCERDIHGPETLVPISEEGPFQVITKARSAYHLQEYPFHPFNVVGWDGYLYPWRFSIHDFEPITGRIHQPPPVHQTFTGKNFVVCSFVPRLFDYHPLSIPVPYYHSNVHSDEVLYYVAGNFMSRKGIAEGSMTLHPAGLPHGPHPGTIEGSLGKTGTEELAVMIDTFRPLYAYEGISKLEDEAYWRSWQEE